MNSIRQSTRSLIVRSHALTGFMCLLFTCYAHAETYNAVNDFSLTGNPNGVWSYLYGGTLLPKSNVGSGSYTGFNYWNTNLAVPDAGTIGKNVTASGISIVGGILPPDQLLLDPESYSNIDVRFTASSPGSYFITGAFESIGPDNSHAVEILDNGLIVFADTISGSGKTDPFNLSETLRAGDTVDFENLTGSTYISLSTGLAATISTNEIPEPEVYYLLPIGIVMVGLAARRKSERIATRQLPAGKVSC